MEDDISNIGTSSNLPHSVIEIPDLSDIEATNKFTNQASQTDQSNLGNDNNSPTIFIPSLDDNADLNFIDNTEISNNNINNNANNNQITFDLDLISQQQQQFDNQQVESRFANNSNTFNNNNNSNINNSKPNNNANDDSYGQLNMDFKLGGDSTPGQDSIHTPIANQVPSFYNDNEQLILKNSKNHAPSYTLNIVVRQFTKYAERKLNFCLNSSPLDQEPNIVEILSEGVDPMFDRIISSLGYIARRTPKRVTDAVMHWRRGKSELREMARSILEKDLAKYQSLASKSNHSNNNNIDNKINSRPSLSYKRSLSRSNKNTSFQSTSSSLASNVTMKDLEEQVQRSEVTFTQADRQFTISTFILWRVLIEVIKQTPSSTLMEDTGLEEIMYNYLRSIDPYLVSHSLIHSANWNLLSELIGYMSEKSFLSVSDRFIADLEKFPTGFTNGKTISDASLNLLIHGMRYLQFSNASLERFEEGADFIKSLAKFFFKCENENIYLSYCDVINQLLLSLAGTLTAEVNHPTWVDAIKVIYTKSMTIANSNVNKYWGSAITLAVTALSVSPKETFEAKWKNVVDMITKKLKPKANPNEKLIIITCVTRLTWAYLYRYPDTLNSKTRTMETLANLLLLNVQKKQQWLTEDALLIQTTVQFFRALAYSQLNFTLENIFIPFLKSAFNNFNFDILNHEKMILSIRAYCCILSDYQAHQRPPYPTDDIIQNSLDPLEYSNIGANNVFEHDPSNSQVHEEISLIFQKVLFLLEAQCGCKILDQSVNATTPKTPSSTTSTSSFHQRISSLTYFHTTEDVSYKTSELFTTAITCISWCANSSFSAQYRKIIELLIKNCIHENATTAQFCIDALKILICKKNPSIILTTFATVAFCLDERASKTFDQDYLSSDNYIKLLEVYLEVLQSWLESLTETEEQESDEKANAMYNVNHGFVQEEIHENKKYESLELKNMATLIDDVEGNGLFFLLSHDFRIRFLGCQILRMVTQFDEAIYLLSTDDLDIRKSHNRLPSKFAAEIGTRVIEVLGSLEFVELAKNKKHLLSEAELKRYNKIISNDRKNTIIKLSESSHGVDAALWFKIFEDILETLVKTCPIQIAIARSHSCIRLVQFYDQIVRINNDIGNNNDNAIIWDYMLYLKIACASLTITNDQHLHIPDLKPTPQQSNTPSIYGPLVKSHSRKKSQQLFTVQHQKITSAKSIFRMTVPLLTSTNSRLQDAIVEGLSCINVNIFKTFIQSIEPSISRWENPFKGGFSSDMVLKQEICCIISKVIYKFSKIQQDYLDESIIQILTELLSNVLHVLTANQSQSNFRYQRFRKYFCNILETLQKELLNEKTAEKWFNFNFRKKSLEFMVEWTGYGQSSTIFSERYSLMRKAISQEYDTLNLQASLELQKHQLQLSSISCISKLCGSPIVEGEQKFDLGVIFGWLDALFKTYNEKISSLARSALLDILIVNGNVSDIFELIVKKCYTHDSALGNYFITLTDALIKDVSFEYEVYLPLSLALFSSGSDNYNVRSAAATLLEFTEKKFYNTNDVLNYVDGVCCRSRIIYKRTVFQLSSYFAKAHPEEKFKMISELTLLFNLVGSGLRRDLVAVLLPWVQTVDISIDNPECDNCLVVLSNFFDITMRYSHKIQNELEALWVALGTGNEGVCVKTIYDYIITNSLSLKNLAFIECSRQVIVSISTIPGNFNLVDSLISNMQPKSMIPLEPEVSKILISEIERKSFPDLPYVAKLSKLIQKNSSTTIPAFSLCELSIIFLADLILIPNDKIRDNLPLLLHLSIALLDHQLFVVQDQAAALIIHLIHEYGDASSEISQQVITSLRLSDHSKKIWNYNDLSSVKNSGRVPDSMDTLVRNILKIFEPKISTIQKDWSITAIHWATKCKVMHVASRSFQVFRCLISFLNQSMLKDMLSCLTNTISDENEGIQGFSMQILMTLNAITSELYSEQLIAFPQLFWSSVASLTTIHENEFIEVLSTLSKFIAKIDFNSLDTVECLSATLPNKWEGNFEGLQKSIMIGLRSSNAYEPTLKLMNKLNQLENSQIIGDGKHRVLLTLLANMPRFLHAHSTKRFTEDIINAGQYLSEMADKNEIVGLSRIIESLTKRRFRNKEDFLSQIVNVLKRYFFPKYSAETLVFLLGLLFNKISWIKIEIMDLLKHIFRVVDLSSEEFIGLGADLISPLLRLLLTDYVDQALEVLDEASSISASPFDKHYLMMSAGDITMRKDYDKIVTLFGIPDESGWSVPMPSVSTAITRNNIHAVYSTIKTDDYILANSTSADADNNEVKIPTNSGSNDDGNNNNGNINNEGSGEESLANEMEKQLKLSEAPYLSAQSQYVQYKPLPFEVQEQVNNYHYQQQEPYNNDNVSVTDKDSLSNMLATLETLDSFFTKDGKEITPNNFGHKYSNSTDTRSTITTTTTNNTMDINNNHNNNGWIGQFEDSNIPQFETTTSFKTLLADVSSPTREKILTSRFNTTNSNNNSNNSGNTRRNSLSRKSRKSSNQNLNVPEPLKLARDLNKEGNSNLILNNGNITPTNHRHYHDLSNSNGSLNEYDEVDINSNNSFSLGLLRQNKTRKRSTLMSVEGNNNGSMLIRNSPISPRHPISPKHHGHGHGHGHGHQYQYLNSPYGKTKFRSYNAYRKSQRPYSTASSNDTVDL